GRWVRVPPRPDRAAGRARLDGSRPLLARPDTRDLAPAPARVRRGAAGSAGGGRGRDSLTGGHLRGRLAAEVTPMERYVDSRRIGDATVTIISDGTLHWAPALSAPEAEWRRAMPEADQHGAITFP